jgi:DNA invertase Pin-like site-specific DNA recombinase
MRVSTGEQTVTNQERELVEAASRQGWEIEATYRDEEISGSNGRSTARNMSLTAERKPFTRNQM